jgi:hypothetical protein
MFILKTPEQWICLVLSPLWSCGFAGWYARVDPIPRGWATAEFRPGMTSSTSNLGSVLACDFSYYHGHLRAREYTKRQRAFQIKNATRLVRTSKEAIFVLH